MQLTIRCYETGLLRPLLRREDNSRFVIMAKYPATLCGFRALPLPKAIIDLPVPRDITAIRAIVSSFVIVRRSIGRSYLRPVLHRGVRAR